jgi:hypothetical protein
MNTKDHFAMPKTVPLEEMEEVTNQLLENRGAIKIGMAKKKTG